MGQQTFTCAEVQDDAAVEFGAASNVERSGGGETSPVGFVAPLALPYELSAKLLDVRRVVGEFVGRAPLRRRVRPGGRHHRSYAFP